MMTATNKSEAPSATRRGSGYTVVGTPKSIELQQLVISSGRRAFGDGQSDLLRSYGTRDAFVHFLGNPDILRAPTVSVVGTRDATEAGRKRASRLARELAEAGVNVMSGLARGIDAAAHTGAIAAGGKTVGVIGTPLDKASPSENAELQMEIAREHLLLTPFAIGTQVYRGNFPVRNKVMALLSDATVIVEASDTSGTLHQAAECLKQGRWLFILQSVLDNPEVSWPKRFINDDKTVPLSSTADLLARVLP